MPRVSCVQAAGLDRLNISLDTLDAAAFARLTRTDALSRVHGAIDAVLEAGLQPSPPPFTLTPTPTLILTLTLAPTLTLTLTQAAPLPQP